MVGLILTIAGLLLWGVCYYRFTRHLPKWDKLRGIPCVPGFVMAAVGMHVLAFSLHWFLGILAVAVTAYSLYEYVTTT